jgi:putative glutamine amidotransferase
VEQARWGPWDELVLLSPLSYARAVQRAGGVAVLLPPDDETAQAPGELLDRLDGLMIAGGSDIDPAAYGARPHPTVDGTSPERDRFELALAHAALERDLPLLGICRGMQLLNVATGGTLEQHLPDALGHERHRHTPGAFTDHDVRLEPDSLAARAAGTDLLGVKSHHHQGVAELGEGLRVTGHAADDDLTEAIEMPDKRFALGVLWHPEADEGSRVVESFVAATRQGAPEPLPIHPGGHR